MLLRIHHAHFFRFVAPSVALSITHFVTIAMQEQLLGVVEVAEVVLCFLLMDAQCCSKSLVAGAFHSHIDQDSQGCGRSADVVRQSVAQSFPFLSRVLSTLFPSSSCSSTRRSGKRLGIILRGVAPSTTEYFEKSSTPRYVRKKSSSSSSSPLTVDVGALSMARIASEKIGYGKC